MPNLNRIKENGYDTNVSLDVLVSHEKNTQDLTDTCQSTRIDLTYVYCLSLEELFKDHPIMCVLSRSYTNFIRFESSTNGSMAKNIVRCCWLLDKPKQAS